MLGWPGDEWIAATKANRQVGRIELPPALTLQPCDAAHASQLLRDCATTLLSAVQDEEGRMELQFLLEDLVARFNSFSAPFTLGGRIDRRTSAQTSFWISEADKHSRLTIGRLHALFAASRLKIDTIFAMSCGKVIEHILR